MALTLLLLVGCRGEAPVSGTSEETAPASASSNAAVVNPPDLVLFLTAGLRGDAPDAAGAGQALTQALGDELVRYADKLMGTK